MRDRDWSWLTFVWRRTRRICVAAQTRTINHAYKWLTMGRADVQSAGKNMNDAEYGESNRGGCDKKAPNSWKYMRAPYRGRLSVVVSEKFLMPINAKKHYHDSAETGEEKSPRDKQPRTKSKPWFIPLHSPRSLAYSSKFHGEGSRWSSASFKSLSHRTCNLCLSFDSTRNPISFRETTARTYANAKLFRRRNL